MIDAITFDENGLVQAIVKDEKTGKVLMLDYMNRESLQKTIETKETWCYSRARQELWNKGATSGHKQQVTGIQLDCDGDSLLVSVTPQGPACHTGEATCFYQTLFGEKDSKREVIHNIVNIIEERRTNPQDGSYTTYLLNEGM